MQYNLVRNYDLLRKYIARKTNLKYDRHRNANYLKDLGIMIWNIKNVTKSEFYVHKHQALCWNKYKNHIQKAQYFCPVTILLAIHVTVILHLTVCDDVMKHLYFYIFLFMSIFLFVINIKFNEYLQFINDYWYRVVYLVGLHRLKQLIEERRTQPINFYIICFLTRVLLLRWKTWQTTITWFVIFQCVIQILSKFLNYNLITNKKEQTSHKTALRKESQSERNERERAQVSKGKRMKIDYKILKRL